MAIPPLSYREPTVSAVMKCIKIGESCSLVGASGVGKTALLRFIKRPEVQEHYLGRSYTRHLFVLVDLDLVAELSEWGIFEFLLNQVARAVEENEGGAEQAELAQQLRAQYEEAEQKKDRLLAQRLLSRCIGLLLRKQFEKIVFFFDEFDSALKGLDFQFFSNLRGLRDEYRPKVVYVTLTRQLFPIIRKDFDKNAEAFSEIFTRNVFPLAPYNREDARRFVSELMALTSASIGEPEANYLVIATGGHSGMIKAAFDYLMRNSPTGSKNIFNDMAEDFNVQDECRKIWNSLVVAERHVLIQAARSEKWTDADDAVAENLRAKGILTVKSRSNIAFFSPLFAGFVKQQALAEHISLNGAMKGSKE